MQVLSERTVAEVADESVSVRKAVLDLARDDVVGIKLSARSLVSHPLAITLVEEFPGHVSMSDVQPHPNYQPKNWSISEGAHRMEYETALHPNEAIETVYGVRVTEDELDPFIAEPSFSVRAVDTDRQSAESAASPAATAQSNDDDPTTAEGDEQPSAAATPRDEPANRQGDGPTDPADAGPTHWDTTATGSPEPDRDEVGDGSGAAEHGSVAPADVSDGEPAFTFDQTPPASTDQGPTRTVERGPDTGIEWSTTDPIDAFIDAIESAQLSDAQRSAIRRALDLDRGESQRIQLAQLQSEVARLAAYADEFERLVESVGSPSAAIDQLRSITEALEETVDTLVDAVETAADDRAELHDRLDRLDSDLQERQADLERRLTGLQDDLDNEISAVADRRQAALSGALADLEEQLREERSTAIESLDRQQTEDRTSALEALEGRIQADRAESERALERRLTQTRAEALDSLERRLTDDRTEAIDALERRLVARLDENVDAIDDRLKGLETVIEADAFDGIREVLAAEHTWNQQFSTPEAADGHALFEDLEP